MSATQLWRHLKAIGGSSSFCCYGVAAWEPPGLEVEGVGPIGLPLVEPQIARVLDSACRAPYGKGEETVVDLEVRRVWQIDPGLLRFSNPSWQATLDGIVARVVEEFALDQPVRAHLYKFLIYEPGGFFKPHRDTEKEKGMFATLIVALPSAHEGGALIVEPEGQRELIDFAPLSPFRLQFAAFYADCQHEVLPVTGGYRACLVYNLCFEGRGRQPGAPRLEPFIRPVAEALQSCLGDERTKLAVPLSHEYSQEGLNVDLLKGPDRARYWVLQRAAEKLEWDCDLALMSYLQEGGAEEYYDRYHRGPRRYTMGDVVKERTTLSHWLTSGLPKLKLRKSEFLGTVPFESLPFRQSVTEATGNEGVTVERRYRTAVAVMWPRQKIHRMLAVQGPRVAVPYLLSKLEQGGAGCLELAREIVREWRFPQCSYAWAGRGKSSSSGQMLKALASLNDLPLARQFLTEVFPRDYDGNEGPALVLLGEACGWNLGEDLASFLAACRPGQGCANLEAGVSLLLALATHPPELSPTRRSACLPMVPALLEVLRAFDDDQESWRDREPRREILEHSFRALTALGVDEAVERLAEHVLAHPQKYDPRRELVPWLLSRPPGGSGIGRIYDHCVDYLESATREPVVFPADWVIPASLKCACPVCQEAQKFLHSPTQQVHRYQAREDLRNHLQHQLSSLDVEFSTHKGRPSHTLVITKNHASYRRRQERFEQDLALLSQLRAMSSGLADASPPG